MMITNTLIFLHANNELLRRKTKKLKIFSFYVMTSLNDVISSKFFVDLESAYQNLSYEVLHDMVQYGTFDLKI